MAVSLAIYVGLFVVAIAGPWWLAVPSGVLAGLFAGNLFMIGHDACHGSYTRRAGLNRLLGRIAFLPSYHPYSPWEQSHNRVHHVYTNLRTRDFVWRPLSKPQYDALPRWRRAYYRACRTPFGLALYYVPELWWPRLMAPTREMLGRPRAAHVWDRVLVIAFMAAQLAAIALVAGDSPPMWALGLACGVLLPWLGFSWLIGFVIYFNHIHPDSPWFDDERSWESTEATLGGTTRLLFPRWTRFFSSNIMDHVAHHVDPRIPLSRLPEAQERIEALLPGLVRVEPWSTARLRAILRACKLYDYRARRWLDYDGRPTSLRE
jgi:omega-6 fatty acid desaturase (delta-12 desaturase)